MKSLKKIMTSWQLSGTLIWVKNVFSGYSLRKLMLLPPLKLTDLDQIFTGGTSHHVLPPCKISSKSELFRHQRLSSKCKNWKKITSKIVIILWQCLRHKDNFRGYFFQIFDFWTQCLVLKALRFGWDFTWG